MKARILGVGLVCLLLGLWAGVARGDRMQSGNLIASLSGDVTPHRLPRKDIAPVSVHLRGNFSTADGSPLPQLRRITIRIGSRGRLLDEGLPVCSEARIRATTDAGAMAACGGALVGHGHVHAQVTLPGQAPLPFKASFLIFNSRTAEGGRLILGSVHSKNPPVSFTLPFVVRRKPGAFGSIISAKLPRSAGKWARIDHFDMTIQRRYSYRGRSRSYVNAGCFVPKGFTGIVFPLAQATYRFAGGHQVTAAVIRACKVLRGNRRETGDAP